MVLFLDFSELVRVRVMTVRIRFTIWIKITVRIVNKSRIYVKINTKSLKMETTP